MERHLRDAERRLSRYEDDRRAANPVPLGEPLGLARVPGDPGANIFQLCLLVLFLLSYHIYESCMFFSCVCSQLDLTVIANPILRIPYL